MHRKDLSRYVAFITAGLLAPAAITLAGASYSTSSNATITHDANNGRAGFDARTTVYIPSATGLSTYQMNSYIPDGVSSPRSVALGSVGHITSSSIAGFSLLAGSGVFQTDPSDLWATSTIDFSLSGRWSATSPSLGPIATGYFTLAMAGFVPTGGSATISIKDLRWVDGNNTAVRFRSDFNYTETITTPGSFARTIITSAPLIQGANNGTLAAGTSLRVLGQITLGVTDAPISDGAALAAAEGTLVGAQLDPINMEFSSAPPTATWTGGRGFIQWNDPATWNGVGNPNVIVDDPFQSLPTVPNQPGARARLANKGGDSDTFIELNGPTTLGHLSIDDDDSLRFFPDESPTTGFRFVATSGNAEIDVGNSHGSATHEIAAPVALGSDLDVTTSKAAFASREAPNARESLGDGDLVITGAIGELLPVGVPTDPPVRRINKLGAGTLLLAGEDPNTFRGGLDVLDGVVEANKALALGVGTAEVLGGQLNYNINGAAHPDTVTQVRRGVVRMGAVPTAADRFAIGADGAIAGAPEALGAFILGQNLALEPGATIINTGGLFEPGSPPLPGLGNIPQYIYGLSMSFPDIGGFTFGSTSSTPWIGLGVGREEVYAGQPGNDILMNGDGQLVALGGRLELDASIRRAGATANLLIRGGGTVALGSTQHDPLDVVTVLEGTLAVNGTLPAVQVDIRPGATLGGFGAVNGPVKVLGDGSVRPGDGLFDIVDLAVGDLDLSPQANLLMEIGAPAGPGIGDSDTILVNGDLRLAGVLTLIPGFGFTGEGLFEIIRYSGALLQADLQFGDFTLDLVLPYQLIYRQNVGGGGSVLVAIPEPGMLSLAAFTGAALLRRRR